MVDRRTFVDERKFARIVIRRHKAPGAIALLRKARALDDDELYASDFDPVEPLETIADVHGAQRAALELFLVLMRHHGEPAARQIFARWGEPPTKASMAEIKNYGLLDRLDMMRPRPNVQQLARKIAQENQGRAAGERIGPRGSTDPAAIERHLRLWVAKRRTEIAAGTWHGPFPPEG
jgi:hypothetical protein